VTGDDEAGEPQADPDFISEEGTGLPVVPVLSIRGRRTWGSPPPVFVPKESTPLAEPDDGDAIPAYVLWAMKYRRHGRLLNRAGTVSWRGSPPSRMNDWSMARD
jgi:hypothetical protein